VRGLGGGGSVTDAEPPLPTLSPLGRGISELARAELMNAT
jgi:hypothetical protein